MECEHFGVFVHVGWMTELESAHSCNSCLTGPQPAALPIKLHPHGDSTQTRTGNHSFADYCLNHLTMLSFETQPFILPS